MNSIDKKKINNNGHLKQITLWTVTLLAFIYGY